MQRLRAVWGKGRRADALDTAEWRVDAFGTLMKFSEYGDRKSEHGWVIDHFPKSKADGGTDEVSNLRPLSAKPKPRGLISDMLATMRSRGPQDA